VVRAIGGDDVEGGRGEVVGAATVPMRRACCGEVRGSGVTVTAPPPTLQSTVELSGRVVGQHELAPTTVARDRPRSCGVAERRTDDRDSGPGAGRSGLDRGRADLPGVRWDVEASSPT
jgi:hypothetical protein